MNSFRNKGDNVEQQWSQNKVYLELGNAGVLAVTFLIILIGSALVWLIWTFGNLIAISLLCLLIVAAAGGIWWYVNLIYTRVDIMASERRRARNSERFLYAPEGSHSIYLQDPQPRYDVFEVSANIVAAGVPMMLPAPEEKKISADDETIVQMWQDGGMTLQQIVDALKPSGVSYYRVQKVVEAAKARGVVRKN